MDEFAQLFKTFNIENKIENSDDELDGAWINGRVKVTYRDGQTKYYSASDETNKFLENLIKNK